MGLSINGRYPNSWMVDLGCPILGNLHKYPLVMTNIAIENGDF